MAENELMDLDGALMLIEQVTGWEPSRQTIKSWVKNGKVDGRQVGGRWFVSRESLNEMLLANK